MVKQIVKEVPKILALDLGTTTGWAVRRNVILPLRAIQYCR
jgi:hypothetical protein